MIWGCMCWEGAGFMCKIDGKMNGELYESILKNELKKSVDWYGQNIQDIIFQHDNDPKHTCKRVKKWLEKEKIQVLDWPAQSPDLNPIEHLWHYLKSKVREYNEPPRGEEEHWRRIEEQWNKIPKEKCQRLIASMPRRIAAVIKAKGGYTKY